jgi:hypothetical protein
MVEAYCGPVVQTDLNKRVAVQSQEDDGYFDVGCLVFCVEIYESIDWLTATSSLCDLFQISFTLARWRHFTSDTHFPSLPRLLAASEVNNDNYATHRPVRISLLHSESLPKRAIATSYYWACHAACYMLCVSHPT